MIVEIRKSLGKSFKIAKFMNPFVKLCARCTEKGKKAFGDLIYRETEEINF